MVRYTGRCKTITGAVNTNQPGLKLSGSSCSIGARAIYTKNRVTDNVKVCGPVKRHGVIWSTNTKENSICVPPAPKCQSLAGGVGRINAPRLLCNKNSSPVVSELIKQSTKLPLYNVIDTSSKPYSDHTTKVVINPTSYKLSTNSKTTVSEKLNTTDFKNITIIGSKAINNGNEFISKYGMPLIVYRKGNTNNTIFINNLNITTNFHPHGLNCNGYVDGASEETVFGEHSTIGKKISLRYKINNNSMTSAWHAHPMTRSSPLVYSGLVMPFIVKDWATDLLDSTFIINDNDLLIVFDTVDLNKDGTLNSARLYSYPWTLEIPVAKTMLIDYPNICYEPIEGTNLINYCTSLAPWRGTFLRINGQISGSYTPNYYCEKNNSKCADSLFCSSKKCRDEYTQVLTHTVHSNMVKIRLVHAGCSYRRSYFGIVDSDNNYLDFWVISSGGGFCKPWSTKMVSLTSLNRVNILIDAKNKKEIYLVAFDFDISLIEKVIPFLPYITPTLGTKPETEYNIDFFNNFSIYTGCKVDQTNKDSLLFDIFTNEKAQKTFLHLMNKLRSPSQRCSELYNNKNIPNFKIAKFNIKQSKCTSNLNIPEIIDIINNQILNIPKSYYYNYPDRKAKIIRKISMNNMMLFSVDCWINKYDIPSLKFKFTDNGPLSKMINNTELTVNKLDIDMNILSTYKIKFSPTTKPLDIIELTTIINNKFFENSIPLKYCWEKKIQDVNGIVNIKTVFITLLNTSNKYHYQLVGNANIMQFMGVQYKTDSTLFDLNNPQKLYLYLSIQPETLSHPDLVTLKLKQDNKMMGVVTMTIPINSKHTGCPFKYMNDNIMNFTVKQDSTEEWVYYNADNSFFDDHPLHFHLTSGFINKEKSSFINRVNILEGSQDLYGIKAGTHVSFNVKFGNFNSTQGKIRNLGYMFHCHYMMHHDMNMMGQFYVEP